MKRIEGVVVLFHPDDLIIDRIKSYIDDLELLYVIDNSIVKNERVADMLRAYPRCCYIDNHTNQGIAGALNCAAKFALNNNTDWLLTMDQDSFFAEGAFKRLINFALAQDDRQVGIISPFHKTSISVTPASIIDEVLTTMTSGNLVSLFAYQQISGFNENYFIDAVDWDYCLRLNLNGFKVLRLNEAILNHNLGNPVIIKSHGKKIITLNYNKTRRYYITRNKLMIISAYYNHYPKFCYNVFRSLKMDVKYILLYENQKFDKVKYMLKGFIHFCLGRNGRLEAPVNSRRVNENEQLLTANA